MALAVLTMAGQWLLTDNRRLRVAKKRSAALSQKLLTLPPQSPDRPILSATASDVQKRLVGAAMVPVGLLLGPLVVIFLWLPLRVDPAVTPPPPGRPMTVTAYVDPNYSQPIRFDSGATQLLPETPMTQDVPTARGALLQLRSDAASPQNSEGLSFFDQLTLRTVRQQLVDDLDRYVAEPQPLAWRVLPGQEPGIYPLALHCPGQPPLTLTIAIGQHTLPQPKEFQPPTASPIGRVEVTYPPLLEQDLVFAKPFARFGWHYDIGWLGVYLLAYIPAMFLSRWLLRVP